MKQHKALFLLPFLLWACGSSNYLPKPEGYHRLELPEHKYIILKNPHPYIFEHSVYAKITPHHSPKATPDWIDITYPILGASVQLTYVPLDKKLTDEKFENLIGDARKLTNKHNIKAYSIEEAKVGSQNGVEAFVFELEGDVPSQFQFYATDSTNNFLRGALYFRTAVKNDSLAPIIEYVKVDIVHLLNTLKWAEQ